MSYSTPSLASTSSRDHQGNPLIQEEDLEEFFEAFTCFKVKHDDVDVLNMSDFPGFMRALGQCPTEAEMIQMFREVGALETEKLTFGQILDILNKHFESPHTDEELTRTFQVFDRSGDGVLGTNEIMFVINSLGEVYEEDEIREMFVEVDKDRDGRIRADDFIALMGVPEKRTKLGTNKSNLKLK